MRIARSFVAAALLWLLCPAAALAEPLDDWLAAAPLAATARREGDAALLAAAARQRALAEAVDDTLAMARDNAATLLAEARAMAAGDPVALALVLRYEGLISRGSSHGRSAQWLNVPAHGRQQVQRRFAGGRSAIVYAEAAAPFAILVAGAPACPSRNGVALCRWIPRRAQELRIQLTNPGSAPVAILLITN